MNGFSKKKIHLTLNSLLTILTLFALIVSVVAWFSSSKEANIQDLKLSIAQKNIEIVEYPRSFLFPCATKFDDVSSSDFNEHCVVVATYVIKGEVSTIVDVDNDDGILGYVLSDEETAADESADEDTPKDYYSMITSALDEYKQDHALSSPYTHKELKKALNSINHRRVGKLNSEGNTVVKIVFWADYDYFDENTALNAVTNGVYSYESPEFDVNVTFIV